MKGNWGSKTIFEKTIGKDKYYAIWEPKNMEHSTNNLPTSYWKLTKGKINASEKNTIRIPFSENFKN